VAEAARFADPSLLSDIQKGGFASPRMAWLSNATGAWADLKDWQSLLHLEAQAVPIPQQRDREWVIYRFALAHEKTGDPQGALRLFEMAFPAISAPWQRVAKARMLLAAGRADDAVLEARRALASTKRDDLLLTIDAFHVVARTLAGSDRSRAVAHAAIAVAVRQEKGYGPDAKLRETLAALDVTELEAADRAAIAEQTAWWKAADTSARGTGEVTKHLAHGGAGFITGDDGKQYYFSKKRDSDRPLLPVGTKVTFEVVSSVDAKKNAPSLKAVKVRSV
jgi:cold shock CspA family protein